MTEKETSDARHQLKMKLDLMVERSERLLHIRKVVKADLKVIKNMVQNISVKPKEDLSKSNHFDH